MPSNEPLKERLRALLAKATPGPWHVSWQFMCGDFGVSTPARLIARVLTYSMKAADNDHENDATLIVEGINALPGLLDTIARLEAEVERLTGCLERANASAERFEREWYLRGDLIGEMVEGISSRIELFNQEAKRIEVESEGDEPYDDGQVQGLRYAALALSSTGAFVEARALIQKAKDQSNGQG